MGPDASFDGHGFHLPVHLVGFGTGNAGAFHLPCNARHEAGRLLAMVGKRSPTLHVRGSLAAFQDLAHAEGFALHSAHVLDNGGWAILLRQGGFVVAAPTHQGHRFMPSAGTIGSVQGLDLPRFLEEAGAHLHQEGAPWADLPWRLAPSVLTGPRPPGTLIPAWWPVSGLSEGVLEAFLLVLLGDKDGLPCSLLDGMGDPYDVRVLLHPGIPYGALKVFEPVLVLANRRAGIRRSAPTFGPARGDRLLRALIDGHHLFHHTALFDPDRATPLLDHAPVLLSAHQRLKGEHWLATHLQTFDLS